MLISGTTLFLSGAFAPEGLEDGYHYGFIVTFAAPQARDAPYLNDPNHRPVAEAIRAAAKRIVVFDI